ncbi:MAG TPA: hypothetical protein VFE05_06040 [Longimicrobiaceae bacterium]|jgi:hypothetical protein|nr:hypothetical protein [Longimicrobiaceae bacterium]
MEEDLACEEGRIMERVGIDSGIVYIKRAERQVESTYTRADKEAARRREIALGGHYFSLDRCHAAPDTVERRQPAAVN